MDSVKWLIKFKEGATGRDGGDILNGQWTLFERASVPVEFGPFAGWLAVHSAAISFQGVGHEFRQTNHR